MKELPGDLKGDEGLARAGGEGKQNAFVAGGDRRHHPLDGDVLVVAAGMRAALVLEGHGGEAVAPGVGLGVGQRPQRLGAGIAGHLALVAGLHVDGVQPAPVGGVGEAHGELAGVVLGLAHALGQRAVEGLGLDDGEFGVAVFEDVVADERLAAPAAALDSAGGDRDLAPDPAAFHDAPARRRKGGVNALGAGLGFVHGWTTDNYPSFAGGYILAFIEGVSQVCVKLPVNLVSSLLSGANGVTSPSTPVIQREPFDLPAERAAQGEVAAQRRR